MCEFRNTEDSSNSSTFQIILSIVIILFSVISLDVGVYIAGFVLMCVLWNKSIKNNSTVLLIIIIIYVVIGVFCIGVSVNEDKPSAHYLEHKSEIDAYDKKHKDDWKGYKGSRRNSFGENEAFRKDGFTDEQIKEYRESHGY